MISIDSLFFINLFLIPAIGLLIVLIYWLKVKEEFKSYEK